MQLEFEHILSMIGLLEDIKKEISTLNNTSKEILNELIKTNQSLSKSEVSNKE